MQEGRKMFQLTKMYNQTAFPEDDLSLGYPVSVYQESIGQAIVEYLVNFEFFVRIMENYGFVLVDKEETVKMGLPGGSAMFDQLFYEMEQETKQTGKKYGDALSMTESEKTVSFLNRYFVFRKIRHVATERVTQWLEQPTLEAETEDESEDQVAKVSKKFNKMAKAPKETPILRPILGKDARDIQIVLGTYDPPTEEVSVQDIETSVEEKAPAIKLAPPSQQPYIVRGPPVKIKIPVKK
jgi:hypothetical protein